MDLRVTSGQQKRIRDNMLRLISDDFLSDAESDNLLDSVLKTMGDGLVGEDGMVSSERDADVARKRSEQLSTPNVFNDDPIEDGPVFDEEDEPDNLNAPGSPNLSDIPSEISNQLDAVSADDSADPEANDGEYSKGFTSFDDEVHDAEMPWRMKRPNLGVDRDVSDVTPGTVMDHGPLDSGFEPSPKDTFHRHGGDDDESKLSQISESLRNHLSSFRDRWSEAHPIIRIGVPVLALLLMLGLVLSTCVHHEKPLPVQRGTVTEPVEEGDSEEPHQSIVLDPKNVKSFCTGHSTQASLAFHDDSKENQNKAWVCFRSHGVDGARIEIYLKRPAVITSIQVVAGWNYTEPNGRNHWNEHRQVTKILWVLGGEPFTQNIDPIETGSTIDIPDVATLSIAGTIQATRRPPQAESGGPFGGLGNDQKVDETFAIGKIKIMGYYPGK